MCVDALSSLWSPQVTGTTSWERPDNFTTPRPGMESALVAAPTWVTLWDEVNQCSYYYNEATGETTYEPPLLAG